MAKRNYYEILGVEKSDSSETIKKSYKKLALQFHPDKVSDDKKKEYETKFKEINEAYSTLGDEEKRKQYDSGGQGNFNGESSFQGADMSDILRDLFGRGYSRDSNDEEDIDPNLRYELIIDFKEAVFGCEKEISINRNTFCNVCDGSGSMDKKFETCNRCNGHGKLKVSQRTPFGLISQVIRCDVCRGKGKIPKNICHNCDGSGIVASREKVKIKIPKGIDNNQTLRIKNAGNAMKNGSEGDLFLLIEVTKDKVFKREGFDVYMELSISFSQAALGSEVAIPTLSSEEIKIKIVKGAESGSILRLKDRGIPFLTNPNKRGDQFVKINVKTPKKLSKAQIRLFEELAKLDK